MKDRKTTLLLAVLALLLFVPCMMPTAAQGYSTVVYCDEVPTALTDWTKNFTLPMFDPSQGTLLKVDLTFDLNITQDIFFENKGSGAGAITMDSGVVLLATTPDSNTTSVNVSNIFCEDVEAFDGIEDFSGPSGCNFTVTTNKSVTRSCAGLSDFIAGSPGEAIVIPATVTTGVEAAGSGGHILRFVTHAGSKACVAYTYESKVI